jgi:Tfp pilus assembly protein PilO
MTVIRKWSALAAALAVAIAVAGWFLLISPKRGEAAEARAATVSQDEANARLTQQLEVLKAQHADLPAQRAKLAVMQKEIPDNPSLPSLVRQLTKAGRQAGVSVDTMAPALPEPMVLAAAVVPAAAATTSATEAPAESGAESSAAADTTTPVAPAAPQPTLYKVPLTLEVTGSYFEIEDFLDRLEELQRSLLVSGFTLAPAEGADSATAEGDPLAPAPGDLTVTLQSRVFMAPAAAPAVVQPNPSASSATGQ